MKSSEVKLPFGLKQNKIVHIEDPGVESGKKCLCVCPGCRSPLIAAKGNIRQKHFRHDPGSHCETGFESAVHKAAKQLILEKKQITLFSYEAVESGIDSKGFPYKMSETVGKPSLSIQFDNVESEVNLPGIKPDILATRGEKKLIIEFFYRHKVDQEKIQKIIQNNVSAIEIDLSIIKFDMQIDWDALWRHINAQENFKWLHNDSAYKNVHPKLKAKLREKIKQSETQYKNEEDRKHRKILEQQNELKSALKQLEIIRSKENIENLQKTAQHHPAWKFHIEIGLSWKDLPEFLNEDVVNGDWIFGCDKRIWQTTIYHFIAKHDKEIFDLNEAHSWLRDHANFRVHRSIIIVSKYGGAFPKLLPQGLLTNLPSSWKTLEAYFFQLRRVGILEPLARDPHLKTGKRYKILQRTKF